MNMPKMPDLRIKIRSAIALIVVIGGLGMLGVGLFSDTLGDKAEFILGAIVGMLTTVNGFYFRDSEKEGE